MAKKLAKNAGSMFKFLYGIDFSSTYSSNIHSSDQCI